MLGEFVEVLPLVGHVVQLHLGGRRQWARRGVVVSAALSHQVYTLYTGAGVYIQVYTLYTQCVI